MKMKIMSLLTVVMLSVFMSHICYAASSGTCGDNLTWFLDSDGTLTISGTGDMFNYEKKLDFGRYTYTRPWNGNSIKYVILNSGVTSIGENAFIDCPYLTGITIPAEVTSIGKNAFGGKSNLTKINVDRNNTAYTDIDGILFNKNMTEIICYPQSKTGTTYTIPSTVETICGNAFMYCENLNNIDMGNNVKDICEGAFYYCSGLKNITISKNTKTIGNFAFLHCIELTDIIIPDGVTQIGDGAFSMCSKLKTITIPITLTYIGSFNFNNGALTDIYYNGSDKDWNNIEISNGNGDLNNAAIHYNVSDPCFTISGSTVTNISAAERTAVVVCADYLMGVLSDVHTQTVTFSAGESKQFSYGQGLQHKIFVWDSLFGIRPLSE